VETLASYFPDLLIRRANDRGGQQPVASQEPLTAATLFVDVAGFTALTDRLAQRGPAGAEALSTALNLYFGRLTDIVSEWGGDILLFAGDAALAIWPCEAETLPAATRAAVACGLAICRELRGFSPIPEVTLHQRASVGAGSASLLHLGGVGGSWHYLVTGDAIRQTSEADRHADPGDVILSPAASVLAGIPGAPLPDSHLRVDSANEAAPRPRSAVERSDDGLLRPYMTRSVLASLDAGHAEWMGEFRQLSLLFVNLDVPADRPPDLETLQRVTESAQRLLAQYEGSVYQFVADDKGTTIIGAFGLPPFGIEDVAARALDVAIKVKTALAAFGVPSSCGVTTGRAFCGAYGSARRRQFTIVGPVINRAARLAQAARGDLLCDGATRDATSGKIGFESLPAMTLKGQQEPIAVYRPLGRVASSAGAGGRPLVGRVAERSALRGHLNALVTGTGGLVWLEGEPGIGKSRLLADFVASAAALGVPVFTGAGDAVERSTPYHAWGDVVGQVGGGGRVAGTTVRDALLERLGPSLAARAPLLNTILPLGLPDSDVTHAMEGEARITALHELVTLLLGQETQRQPVLLILDDMHWVDSASCQLALAVLDQVPRLLLIAASRPPDQPVPESLKKLMSRAASTIVLDPIAAADLPALIAGRLGVATVPDELVTFILARAEGHPFFSEELAAALREAGMIGVRDGACEIVGPRGLAAVDFPDNVQGVVAGRISRLPPHEQLSLKTASVIGRSFAHRTLLDVYPVSDDRPRLPEGLDHLVDLDLTRVEIPEPVRADLFRHVITQEVAYGSLLFAQRRALHHAVAEWYEGRRDGEGAVSNALLAHHWEHAEQPVRAIDYLEAAADQAVQSYANREAVGFLVRAIALAEAASVGVATDRRAQWEFLLGEAHINMTEYRTGAEHHRRSLELLGYTVPQGRRAVTVDVLRQLGAHLGRRIVGRGAPAIRGGDGRGPARSYRRLAEVAFFESDSMTFMHGIVASLNVAERQGATRLMIEGYGSVAVLLGLMHLAGPAKSYMDRAMALAAPLSPSERGETDMDRMWAPYGNARGDWRGVEEAAARGCELYGRLGNRFYWESCRAGLGYSHLFRGNFGKAIALFEETFASARHGALQSRLFSRAGHLAALLESNAEIDPALVDEYRTLVAKNVDRTETLVAQGLLSLVHLRRGELADASPLADRAIAMAQESPPMFYYTLWSLAGTCDTEFARWAAGDKSDEQRKRIHQSVTALERFAFAVPTAGPRAALQRGRGDWLLGRRSRALKSWQKGVVIAARLEMRHEEALLHLALASALPPEAPGQSDHARRAEALLAPVGLATKGARTALLMDIP
jgi:class 3 adenylate cyclase/tetratricopeptide (TPR) repeat protein